MILLENVTKKYNGVVALEDVNLSIGKGEFVFVVGASGAGKSTLIKMLFREEVPSTGRVTVCGSELSKLSNRQIAMFRRNVGVVFQDFRLIPTMTVYDNVAFALRVTNASTKYIKRRVPYVLNLVGLLSKAKKYPDQLSGGEQQRTALARALANNPDLIIADEPTGNVDPQMSYEIVSLLNLINECGTTIVMVTHQHDLVEAFNRRTIALEDGRVVVDGRVGGRRARK